jgi:hypothetical protein
MRHSPVPTLAVLLVARPLFVEVIPLPTRVLTNVAAKGTKMAHCDQQYSNQMFKVSKPLILAVEHPVAPPR